MVDVPGLALGGQEDAADGIIGEETLVSAGALHVEAHVVACVFKGEGPEGEGVANAGAQGVECWVPQGGRYLVGAGEKDR